VRRLAAAALLGLLCVSCAAAEKPKGRLLPGGARVERDLDPPEIFPADLDLVVRVDLARMRAGMGPAASDDLTKRALAGAGEPEIASALACAEVVWIAARVAEIESGDRVVVVEGKACMPDLARSRWEKVRSANKRVLIFDRKGEAPRAGTARILNLGDHGAAFVSPVELDSVKRVLDAGPDPRRGNPTAEGVVSVDLRARPLSPALAKRYPSIAAVLAGIERVRGSATLSDDGLHVDAQVVGKTPAGAALAGKFLTAVRESLAEGKFAEAAKGAKVEVVGKTVEAKLVVPAKLLLAALAGKEPGEEPAPPDAR
jgi:hypothetical protein